MNEEIHQPEPHPTDPNDNPEELAAEHSEELTSEDESIVESDSEPKNTDEPAVEGDTGLANGNSPAESGEDSAGEADSSAETGETLEAEIVAADETIEEVADPDQPEADTASTDEFPAELELAANLNLPPILEMFDEETGEAKFSEIATEEEPSPNSEEPGESAAEEVITATREELKPVIESLLFVADEPLPFKQLCKVLGEVPEEDVRAALEELVADLETRNSGLEIREIAGGWRLSTRPQNHEFIRKYLKSRPSARLSLPALETLAVIAYKQPVTIPEILEIRGVSSSSAIKTLLEKRLIVTKGRKETVGRPMMYGTSKEFLIQFGLKDLNELPSFEDFEDLMQ